MKTNTWEVEWFYPERGTELIYRDFHILPTTWKLCGPSGGTALWAPSTPSLQTAQSLPEVRVRWDWEESFILSLS